MKFNQWTLGLAAVGVISFASAARAEETAVPLMTALSATTISGYVDTSVEWMLDRTSGDNPQDFDSWGHVPFRTASKQNGFNLNVVDLTIQKALDESEWASGYKVELLFGPDAVGYNPSSESINGQFDDHSHPGTDFAIKNAYVALRTPVGNGLDWKIGVFDSVIGYESFAAANDPNFTRSWGYAIEPTQHTGILATYRVTDNFSVSAGVANTLRAGINTRNVELQDGESLWRKTYMGSIALSAPDSWGSLSGSTLYAGFVGGFAGTDSNGNGNDQRNLYVGATINTPVTGLKAGVAFDWADHRRGTPGIGNDLDWDTDWRDDAYTIGLYASYQATEKLSLHARAEYGDNKYQINDTYYDGGNVQDQETGHEKILSLTGTIQYDLWQNVVSRLEVRWDQMETKGSWSSTYYDGEFGGVVTDSGSYKYYDATALGVYANVIYKF